MNKSLSISLRFHRHTESGLCERETPASHDQGLQTRLLARSPGRPLTWPRGGVGGGCRQANQGAVSCPPLWIPACAGMGPIVILSPVSQRNPVGATLEVARGEQVPLDLPPIPPSYGVGTLRKGDPSKSRPRASNTSSRTQSWATTDVAQGRSGRGLQASQSGGRIVPAALDSRLRGNGTNCHPEPGVTAQSRRGDPRGRPREDRAGQLQVIDEFGQ